MELTYWKEKNPSRKEMVMLYIFLSGYFYTDDFGMDFRSCLYSGWGKLLESELFTYKVQNNLLACIDT